MNQHVATNQETDHGIVDLLLLFVCMYVSLILVVCFCCCCCCCCCCLHFVCLPICCRCCCFFTCFGGEWGGGGGRGEANVVCSFFSLPFNFCVCVIVCSVVRLLVSVWISSLPPSPLPPSSLSLSLALVFCFFFMENL